METYLSPNFLLGDLTKSQTALERGFTEQFAPSVEVVNNLKRVAAEILEPLKAHYKESLYVSSGYRCSRLNKAVGGSRTSAHLAGLAVDVKIVGKKNADAFTEIRKILPHYDQIIEEFGRWVHIGLSKAAPRHESLVAIQKNGIVQYLKA